ncbi:hypothetical protein DAPPUDRAFT_344855 [Daphnia pulex]|uniref:Uncharacterized protein n=1 Tax=Daphnia pulex TaxID=6669 RepID=E9I743_DAPPU|nr:hypothetical protein DAPPUDRAFT_344855 [Daphnia pulex]|eukprot:EFX60187.1 hypothetical protein DAPPUDRAFT_344855 [Daphnia pulex]
MSRQIRAGPLSTSAASAKTHSSKLFLPKIRHFLSKSNSNDKEEKKYIEIEIKEEEDQIALNTEIEEEHKYDIETKRINYRLNSKKRTKNIIESLMKQSHAIPKKQESLSTSFRFNNVLLE